MFNRSEGVVDEESGKSTVKEVIIVGIGESGNRETAMTLTMRYRKLIPETRSDWLLLMSVAKQG